MGPEDTHGEDGSGLAPALSDAEIAAAKAEPGPVEVGLADVCARCGEPLAITGKCPDRFCRGKAA